MEVATTGTGIHRQVSLSQYLDMLKFKIIWLDTS